MRNPFVRSFRLAALFLSALLSRPVFAYDSLLQPESIRDAYFLGRRHDENTAAFLAKYLKRLPLPEKGPHVSEIALYTPYAQVVLNSWRNASIYSAQQAEQDYRTNGDAIRVRVMIEFTPTFNTTQGIKMSADKDATGNQGLVRRTKDFWREFQYELRQKEKSVNPRSVEGKPIYSDDDGITGAEVLLLYDAVDVASEDTTFDVYTPDDHHVIAKFNLAELR